MKRTDFIKKLLVLGGLPFISKKTIIHYKKYYLFQCFVRGFRYYNGPALLVQMQEGDMLQLVREADNQHDPYAVALFWNKQKIGFLPAESNELISKLLDIGVPELCAEISFLKMEAAAWENVHISVYVLKETKTGITENAAYLTMLDTPNYRSLKRRDDIITRLDTSEDDDEVGVGNYYNYLIDNSKDDSMYGHIHNRLDAYARYEEQGDFLIVNTKELATRPDLYESLKNIESSLYDTSAMFSEDGYIALNVRKAENFICKITDLEDVTDKLGRKFIALHF